MTNEHSANSSDLERARELSRKLNPGPPRPTVGEAKESERPYIRFRAAAVLRVGDLSGVVPEPPDSPSPLRAVPGPVPPAAPPQAAPQVSGSPWGPLLDWCRSVSGAESAFVLHPYGLIVAVRGPLPEAEAGEMGSRLMVALEHARKMPVDGAGDASVAFDLGGRWLSGFSFPLRDGTKATFAAIGPNALDGPLRRSFEKAFGDQV